MATLSLKISVVGSNAVKTMQFHPSTIVYDACKIIREKIPEANHGNPPEFGLFLADEDPKKGVWLESGRTLEYYLLRNGDLLEYKKKHRMLRVRMLDGTVKTLQVDDSHTVSQLMITICSKIGIMNHEEYSLVHDLSDDEKEKTLTLKRDRSIAKDQKKLDEMKRKLHTDDELNWLDHSKTLREQGVDLNETLLLRRKFFFSDQNVDARDPVQLNLLYVQTRDAICKGAHPVSQDEAVKFAGLQCQIQFGDYIPNKHKSGFLDLKEFLPREYVKVKGIEKKIFAEHKERANLSEIDSKVKYTALARSLKTYGITFFLVKEKMKGKNKMVPRLLGITKDSIVRVDEKTKQTLKTWPLTTVRRWAASPNSFTLDFGDYSDDYYSVQTTEGEQISQLIAGYIDIIVKKKKDKDYFGIEGDEESSMFEDSVSPAKATIIQHQSSKVGHANVGSVALPAVLRAGDTGQAQYSTGSMGKAQYSKVSMQAHSGHVPPVGQNVELHGLERSQRALLSNIETSLTAVQSAQTDLEQKSHLPPLGSDPASMKWRMNARDMSAQNVGAQLSAMTAATAQVVTLTSGGADDTDYNAVGSAVATISSNIGGLTKDVKMLAALDETDDGNRLMDATRRLIGAFSDLLNAAQPGGAEPRQNMLAAASKIGEASHDLMTTVGDADVDHSIEEALLALAKAVANATAALVLKAKGVASRCDNQADQNKVIGAATHCALATSQLVACTKVVAPTMQHPACQDQLVDAAKHVAKSVDIVVDTAQGTCNDDQAIGDLRAAATEVSRALNDLLQQIKSCAGPSRETNEVDTILTAADRLTGCMGDTPEMVRQARILAQATSMLVNDLKSEAETSSDSNQQQKLLAAAKVLADATAKMVEAAKGCASSPQDKDQQQALKQAAEDLRAATGVAASSASKKQIIHKLEVAAKHAASASTQLINASNGASPYNTNDASQQQLMSQCKVVADESIPKLVHGIKGTMNNPEDPEAQMVLIAAAQDMLLPGGKLLASAKAAVPTISEQAVSMSVTGSAKNLAAALAELLTATTKAQEACGSLEIDGALFKVRKLEKDLEEVRKTAHRGNLVPLPGETAEDSATQLGATSKTVGSSMAQLLTAAAQGNDNYTGTAARDTANALEVLMEAARGVAATTGDRALQENILACAIDVMDKSANLIQEAKKAVNNPNNPDNQTRLAQVAKAVSQALNTCVNCLPGLREVDTAAKQVNTISQRLTNIQYPVTDRTFPTSPDGSEPTCREPEPGRDGHCDGISWQSEACRRVIDTFR
ncbi:Talin-1 [Lamellibrachia satsuma]|nr:Talin-1 [Lamellibrachia satsuma]